MSRINLTIQDLSLSVGHKQLLTHFSAVVPHGSRIGIIGRNGSGKSTLLQALAKHAGDAAMLVPQIITDHADLSGGQRFNKALSAALASQPEILLLDEPTNHLDVKNRQSLLRMLNAFDGTLIIVTHDIELLRTCIGTIWHFEDGTITISNQSYDEYIRTTEQKRTALTEHIALLNRQKKEAHTTLMKEQERAKKKKAQGAKAYAHDDKLLKRHKQASGQLTGNKNRSAIIASKEEATAALAKLRTPEHIMPTFTLPAASHVADTVVTITDGSAGYAGSPVLSQISLTIQATERIALMGANGSGKSTFIKALVCDASVITTGLWQAPKHHHIGYLDQQYTNLNPTYSVFETIKECMPHASINEIRTHLNRFLFRSNEAVATLISQLSGGEKARLSLAIIGACTPALLILDEVTNNVDRETRQHIIEVLKAYPGALIVISHDHDFLTEIGITTWYEISRGCLQLTNIL